MQTIEESNKTSLIKETEKIIIYMTKGILDKEIIYTVCNKNQNILYADFNYLHLINYLKKEKIISKKEYDELESLY